MVVDMIRGFGRGGHVDGAHAHLVGGGKVAGVIFEHRGLRGIDAITGKDPLESVAVGFGAKVGVFNAVDRVEQARKPPRRDHLFGVGGRTVGIDDASAGQGGDTVTKRRVGGKGGKVDVMHGDQIGQRIHPMFAHQPGKGGAVGLPVMVAQMVGLGRANAKLVHHIGGHALFDLVEQPHRGRVKRIVKVEDPGSDMREVGLGHRIRPDMENPLRAGLHAFFSCRSGGGKPRPGRVMSHRACKTPPARPRVAPHRVPAGGRGDRKGRMMQKDAYTLILEAIEQGDYRPGDRLVESDLAERFGVSRTPVREALQRLETQSMLARDGRSLIVASLDHNPLAELYAVRAELEGLAARLAAKHASPEEVRVLRGMVEADRAHLNNPEAMSRANKRFHKQIHLASHNRYLVQQLDLVHRSMALLATTSLAAVGRSEAALAEHDAIVRAIEAGDGDGAQAALRAHISKAFETRLKLDSGSTRRQDAV